MIELHQDYEPQFIGFHDLMKHRIREILIVSSIYDAFVLEEDGQLGERIFSEYIDLNLSLVPRVKRVSTAEEAFAAFKERSFDLVITMPRIVDMDIFKFGEKVKEIKPDLPVIMLTYNTVELEHLSGTKLRYLIDKIFYWSGDSKLLVAIIKYIEDYFNVINDIRSGVRVILVVEDSPLYYSSILPVIYTEIMTQTRLLILQSVNDFDRLQRMRARPKILLAESFEDAVTLFDQFRHNILGVISDIRFFRNGKVDPEAGFRLVENIKSKADDIPILLDSSEPERYHVAQEKNVSFLHKNSQNFLHELRKFIVSHFGFGDFIFRYPDGREVARAKDLQEMEIKIDTIPVESFEYHVKRNHISTWLMARTEFKLATELRPKQISDFKNTQEARKYIVSKIRDLRESYQQGIIADFHGLRFDPENSFVKLGTGSLGGKGRGLAFINALLAQNDLLKKYKDIEIKIPRLTVICTEIFEQFMEMNHLKEFAINTGDDNYIAERFLKSILPEKIYSNLRVLLEKIRNPLAVRSSSLLEDSQFLPFAGLYNTYMLPNNHPDINIRMKQLCDAIRLVYASTYFQSPKAYAKNTHCRIEEQKMAIIIQQLAGEKHGDIFYPVISGVAQSYNFYPFPRTDHKDGIAHLALGLGKTVVEGGKVYTFCPAYPKIPPPYLSPAEFMENSQSHFYALPLNENIKINKDEISTLKTYDLVQAQKDGTLFFVGSTYSIENQVIRDTIMMAGPKIVTFANILKYEIFPMAELLADLLKLGQNAFASPIEIEFALNLYKDNNKKPEFFFLQIRPMVLGHENIEVTLDDMEPNNTFCMTSHAMGNGVFENLYDIVYIDPETFDIGKSRLIAKEIGNINQKFIQEKRNYILLGYGRWGTSDPWLGIPVEWSQVSEAKVIIEANLDNFKVDPSQGSHFFHNITSLRLGYFFIQRQSTEEFIDWEWIKTQKIYKENTFIKTIRFSEPLRVKIDGRSSRGVILKPSATTLTGSTISNKSIMTELNKMENMDMGFFR